MARQMEIPAIDGVRRRQVLQAGGLSALGLLIAACGGGNTPNPTINSSGSSVAGKPVHGGTLTFATAMDITTLDPAFSQNFSERFAFYAMYNTLVAYDQNFNLVPELAERWQTSKDGKTLTLFLRKGVKFHDGTPFNAAAVKWNLDRLLDESTNSPLRGQLTPPVRSVKVVDDSTVALDLQSAWRPLLAALGERPGFMISPTAYKKYGKDYGLHPVGTGPFEFVSFTQNSSLKLKRFDGYWDPSHVYLDGITFQNVQDAQVQLTMLRTGEAQIADQMTPQLATTLQGVSSVAVSQRPTGDWYAMQMDCDKPPFNDARLRQAIAYATNRDGVRDALFLGKARDAAGPIGIGWAYDAHDSAPVYAYDLDKAKALVAQANATGKRVRYVNSSQSDYQSIAQLLHEDYVKTGLNLQVGTVPASDYYNSVVADKNYWSLTKWTPRADPDGLLRNILHSGSNGNTTGYHNPEVDRLLDEAAGINDLTKAAPLYHQICRLVEKDAPYAWVIWPDALVPHTTNLGGLKLYPDGIYRLRSLWIAK
ncbi:ABC transporter substrate-binding protein [Streptomyces carpinensis]|uniref:ABC transporter substrate-binding protein n=1 Tax=Streptomyces carpinensis TaxID=66369 RepID=A0ABV1VYF8_9ACTN|nr:ABC transporter substrate-binding protein [Streptomyces carpinensis]